MEDFENVDISMDVIGYSDIEIIDMDHDDNTNTMEVTKVIPFGQGDINVIGQEDNSMESSDANNHTDIQLGHENIQINDQSDRDTEVINSVVTINHKDSEVISDGDIVTGVIQFDHSDSESSNDEVDFGLRNLMIEVLGQNESEVIYNRDVLKAQYPCIYLVQ